MDWQDNSFGNPRGSFGGYFPDDRDTMPLPVFEPSKRSDEVDDPTKSEDPDENQLPLWDLTATG